ncbi:hypothetical protein [Thermomonas sp. HDW16]|uniref:hypothetical protein n=1 Tax=Thermomonas sp. HDW16 TaxID=2714945 RepID=UPI00140C111F|nr:hypothetical protein [Thermomonas sp. HDW16]QIL21157.1 hypothetical protein G7079_10680 [Thermomonas sp. HDW16]
MKQLTVEQIDQVSGSMSAYEYIGNGLIIGGGGAGLALAEGATILAIGTGIGGVIIGGAAIGYGIYTLLN